MIFVPILGALLEGVGTIIDKKILKNPKINFKNYVVYGFLAIILVMLPFIYFLWELKSEAFQLINLLIFGLIVLTSIFANLLMYYSLKRKNVTAIEPIRLMQPLFTILIAFVLSFFFEIYKDERNYSILILSLLASLALVLSHVKKHHLVYDKYVLSAVGGSFFFAFELAVSKLILSYYSSFSFYFLRSLSIFLITLLIFRPKLSSIPNKCKYLIFIVSAIWVIYRVILYYGYITYGVIFTTVLFILAPVFIYIFAAIFLKEKINLRNIISSMVIVTCVVLAVVFRG